MATPNLGYKEPMLISVDEIQKDLHKLKKSGSLENTTHIWQIAGHIWESANWIDDMAKNSQIRTEVYKIRKSLSDILSILKTPVSSNLSNYHLLLGEIESACHNIHSHL